MNKFAILDRGDLGQFLVLVHEVDDQGWSLIEYVDNGAVTVVGPGWLKKA